MVVVMFVELTGSGQVSPRSAACAVGSFHGVVIMLAIL